MNEYMKMLGHKAVDKVTGYKGVVSSVCFDLYGCVQIALSPEASSDGKLESGHWFDAKRLTITSKKPVMAPPPYPRLKAGEEIGPAVKPSATTLPVR